MKLINLKNKIYKFEDEIFDLAVFLLIVRTCLGDSLLLTKVNNYIGSYLSILVIVLFLLLIIIAGYNKIYLFIMSVFGFVCIYTSIIINSNWLIYLWLISFVLKDKKLYRVIKIFFYIKLLLITFHFVIFIVTYITNKNLLEIVENSLGRPKYLMFFVSQNKVAQYLIFILLEYIYLFDNKLSKVKWIIIWIISFIFWYICGSDTILLCVPILSALLIFRKNKFISLFTKLFSKYGFAILACVSLILIVTYNRFPQIDFIYRWIDSLISGRIKLASQAIDLYGFTFLGQNSQFGRFFTYNGQHIWYLFVDNAYAYFYVHIGYFYLILFSFIFIKASRYLKYNSKVLICIYCIYSFAENTIIYSITFIPLIIAIYNIINRYNIEVD